MQQGFGAQSFCNIILTRGVTTQGDATPIQLTFAALCTGWGTGAERGWVGQGLVATFGRGHPGHPPARPQRLGRARVPGAGERAGGLAAGGPPGGARQRAQVSHSASGWNSGLECRLCTSYQDEIGIHLLSALLSDVCHERGHRERLLYWDSVHLCPRDPKERGHRPSCTSRACGHAG